MGDTNLKSDDVRDLRGVSSSSQVAPIVSDVSSAFVGSSSPQNPLDSGNPSGAPRNAFGGSRAPIEAIEPSVTTVGH